MSNQLRLMTPAGSSENVAATTAKTVTGECVGLLANADGNFVGQLVGDSANRSFTLAAGAVYPFRVASIDATSAIAVTLLYAT